MKLASLLQEVNVRRGSVFCLGRGWGLWVEHRPPSQKETDWVLGFLC